MSQGVAAAVAHNPGFLLLTDADIEYVPGEVAALVDRPMGRIWTLSRSWCGLRRLLSRSAA